jgi:hypothetical protein
MSKSVRKMAVGYSANAGAAKMVNAVKKILASLIQTPETVRADSSIMD